MNSTRKCYRRAKGQSNWSKLVTRFTLFKLDEIATHFILSEEKTLCWRTMREWCCCVALRKCDARRERQTLYCEHFHRLKCWDDFGWFCHFFVMRRDDCGCWMLRCQGYQCRDRIDAVEGCTRGPINSTGEC